MSAGEGGRNQLATGLPRVSEAAAATARPDVGLRVGSGVGTVRLGHVVLDCPDPVGLARFYAGLLGLEVEPWAEEDGSDENAEWRALAGSGVRLAFQRARPYTPPRWPDGPPQQVHLDIEVSDLVAAHAWAVSLGAQPLSPTTPPDPSRPDGFRVYADPAGHPFCLCP